jgi:hypothetical protein
MQPSYQHDGFNDLKELSAAVLEWRGGHAAPTCLKWPIFVWRVGEVKVPRGAATLPHEIRAGIRRSGER